MDDASTNQPLYIQISDNFLKQIESGELSPGDQLPPERKLSELLGVNRLTLRHALERLETLGALRRQHGVGNYIAEPKIERQTGRLISFTNGMQKRGYIPGARVVEFEKQPVESVIAQKLGIPVLSTVYYIKRLRLINNAPVMLEQLWISVDCLPEFEKFDLNKRSVYEVIEVEYQLNITKATRTYEAVHPNQEEADLLNVDTCTPMMLVQRLGYDRSGDCIEFGKDLYQGDRFRFMTSDAKRDY